MDAVSRQELAYISGRNNANRPRNVSNCNDRPLRVVTAGAMLDNAGQVCGGRAGANGSIAAFFAVSFLERVCGRVGTGFAFKGGEKTGCRLYIKESDVQARGDAHGRTKEG